MRLRVWLVAVLALASGLRGQSFEDLAARARQALEAEQVDQAIDLYQQATGLRPDWAEGWWRLGGVLHYKGRYAQARDAYSRLVAIDPKSGPAFAMIGLCEFELKHYEGALVALEQGLHLGLASNPELEREALYRDATLHSRFGQPDIALKRLDEAIGRAAVANPGAMSDNLLQHSELVDAFGIAALRIPKLPSEVGPAKAALVRKAGRAQALVSLHDWVAAEAEFKELANKFGGEPGVHYMLGVFLQKQHPVDALAEFDKEIQISPKEPDPRLQIALVCLRAGDYDRARKNAAEAVALAPQYFVAHLVSARLWLALENADKALQEAKIAVKLAEDSPDAHLTLSQCYALAGRAAEAERERAEFERLKSAAQASGQ